MTTRTLRLIYPPSLLRKPVINQLIQNFGITINILRAHITLEEGWLDIKVSGESKEIETAVNWLIGEGIEVQEVG
ncbi:MAG: NIL domain-containing protein [Anaerolineales bacterium]|jgi:ABC-type methionine transport system ATPase subunit